MTSESRSKPVPRALRVLNVVAGVLFLAGAAVYLWAWLGMDRLRAYSSAADALPFAGMAQYNHYLQLSRIGIGLVLAALAVAVIAALAAVVSARRPDAPTRTTRAEPPPDRGSPERHP